MARIPTIHRTSDITLKRGVVTDSETDTFTTEASQSAVEYIAPGVYVQEIPSGVASSDADYTYTPTRSVSSFVNKSLHQGNEWAVFEPNDSVDKQAEPKRSVDAFVFEPNDEPLWAEVEDSRDRPANLEQNFLLDPLPKTDDLPLDPEDPSPCPDDDLFCG